MKLERLSASSLQTYMDCPAKYHAEKIAHASGTSSRTPAKKGSICHLAIQNFVQAVYVDKRYPDEWGFLVRELDNAMALILGDDPEVSAVYQDALEMLKNWHDRAIISADEVVSLEERNIFQIKTSVGYIPVTYIIDRLDRKFDKDGRMLVEVIDYKTQRENVTTEDLRWKIQVRIYALAAMMLFTEKENRKPDEIWVTYDLLRYGPVSVMFTRDDCAEIWKTLRKWAERIIKESEDHPKETLGKACMYCLRKGTCESIMKNAEVGGMESLDQEGLMSRYLELDAQNKATKYALEEINDRLLQMAIENDETEFESGPYSGKISSRRMRRVDNEKAATILGPVLTSQIGKINVTDIDRLLKSTELSDTQKSMLRSVISTEYGEPKVKITRRLTEDDLEEGLFPKPAQDPSFTPPPR